MKKEQFIQTETFCVGILLSGGKGKRVGGEIPKQYRMLDGKPLIYYGLKAFEECDFIQEVFLVVGKEEVEKVKEEIIKAYSFQKVTKILVGGKERYHSVWNGLKELKGKNGYVFIQDGARPFLNQEILERGYQSVEVHKACVAGVPSKDTIKKVDERGRILETPNRSYIWNIQTPQVFEIPLILQAYKKLMKEERVEVTDDASVVECMENSPVYVFEGDYDNIKVTTKEDFEVAESIWRRIREKK